MKYLKLQNGYTLAVAILLLLLFSVIGMGLMGLTANGSSKNVIREDVTQATEQAEKGLNHISLAIQKKLEDKVNSLNKQAPDFKTKYNEEFNKILTSYLCGQPSIPVYGSGALSYTVCLDAIPTGTETLKTLSFTSKGTADDEKKVLQSQIQIGNNIINYPEALNYAVATHDEGNLILNGGVEVVGNVKADGNIFISNKGHFRSLITNIWIDSVYPTIKASSSSPSASGNAKLYVNNEKKLYPINTTSCSYTGLNSSSISSGCLSNSTSVTKAHDFLRPNDKPDIIKSNKSSSIDIASIVANGKTSIKNKVVKSSYKTSLPLTDNYTTTSPTHPIGLFGGIYNTGKTLTFKGDYKLTTPDLILTGQKYTFDGNFYFTGSTNITGSTLHLTEGSNTLKGDYYFENKIIEKTSIYLTGGTQVLDGNFYASSGILKNAIKTTGGNHTFKGSYYLDGDLDIDGGTINADAVFFVNGNVNIDRAVIKGLNLPGGKKGKLIIFATGDITYNKAYNIGSNLWKEYYNETPVELDAYLYSKGTIELHGTISNIKINGGLAAKKVILSGTRGQVDKIIGIIPDFPSPTTQNSAQSRLIINYDPDVAGTFDKNTSYTEYNDIDEQPISIISRKFK